MNNERPKPRYGEYADPANPPETLDGKTWVDPKSSETKPEAVVTVRAGREERHATEHSNMPKAPPVNPGTFGKVSATSTVERIISIVLLGLLGYSTLNNMISFANVTGVFDFAYRQQGIGPFIGDGNQESYGIAIVVTSFVIFLLTVWWTVRRIRAQKRSFWVPIIGWATLAAVTIALLVVIAIGDPTFQQYIESLSRTR